MEMIRPFLIGAGIAIMTALVALAASWAIGRRSGRESWLHWGPALAIGAGYVVFHTMISRPAFPPVEVTDRVPWIALGAMVLGLLESACPGPAWTRWENRLLLSALTLGLVLGPVLASVTEWRGQVVRLAALAALLLFCWANLEALACGASTAWLGPAILAVCASTAAALQLSGHFVGFQLAGGLATALGTVWVTSLVAPAMSLSRGGVPVLTATLAALLMLGNTYSSLPATSGVLLALAPVAAWVGWIGPVRRLAPWLSSLVALAAVGLPLVAALGFAFSASPSSDY
jgi:hypothetical protein